MRLFFAYSSDYVLKVLNEVCKAKKIKINLLNSYEYMRAVTPEISTKIIDKWFIFDSGAYTVWKTGGKIDIEK